MSVPHLAYLFLSSSMDQATISSLEIPAREALYKQCSGAAVATTRAIVRLSQMRPDDIQRQVDLTHVNSLRISMQEEGVRKGEVLHGYIDVEDPAWGGRSQDDAIALFKHIESHNKLLSGGRVVVGVLPKDIPIRITNGNHRLYAFSRHLAASLDQTDNANPPLNSPSIDRPFAENLSRSSGEILAHDDAWWLVSIEYIRK